ncbi:MAG: glycosyltransferase family 61 protein [Pirellulales bacterium]|nr:glycosyltransferase family 61 protein [Pirellulales bacterium]
MAHRVSRPHTFEHLQYGGIAETHVLALTAQGKLIEDCFFGGIDRRHWFDNVNPRLDGLTEVKIPRAYLLHIKWWRNFFHFMMELFPNMHYFSQQLMDTGCLLMVPELNKVISECLEICGIPSERVLVMRGNTRYLVTEFCYSPTSARGDTQQHAAAFRHLATYFSDVEPSCPAMNKVFISRADNAPNKRFNNNANGRNRTIENEAAIQAWLDSQGFAVRTVGTMTFRQKAAMLRDVEFMVTSHGGNMMNCPLAPKLKRLLMMSPQGADYVDESFRNMMAAVNPHVDFQIIYGPQASDHDEIHFAQSPYSIELSEFKEVVRSW